MSKWRTIISLAVLTFLIIIISGQNNTTDEPEKISSEAAVSTSAQFNESKTSNIANIIEKIMSIFERRRNPQPEYGDRNIPRMGTLCRGEQNCQDFCKYNFGRCKAYCGVNPQNPLCQKSFTFETPPNTMPETKIIKEKIKPPIIEKKPTSPVVEQKTMPAITIAESQLWVPDAFMQPLPPRSSRTRLILPAPIDKISLKTLGVFGAHQGTHIEGLDHEWIGIKNDVPIGSWGDGEIKIMKKGADEIWKIRIDYGDGLWGEFMEIKTPLVKVGDTVKAGDPIGYGIIIPREPDYQSAEFTLGDEHRKSGVTSWTTNGDAVSPFDYLKEDAKKELIDAFTKQVIEPYIAKGQAIETITPWEPYFTNPMFLHKNYKGTIVGEWLLKSRNWHEKDRERNIAYDIITFLPPNPTKYYPHQRAMAINEIADGDTIANYFSGPVEIDYSKKQFRINTDIGMFYGIFELDESRPRALLKMEYKISDAYPENFSENALTYIERDPIGIRQDAYNLGVRASFKN